MSWLGWNRPTGSLVVPTPAKRDEGQANSTYWMNITAVDGYWAFVHARQFVYEGIAALEVSEVDPTKWTFIPNRDYTNETLLAQQQAQRGPDAEVSGSTVRR